MYSHFQSLLDIVHPHIGLNMYSFKLLGALTLAASVLAQNVTYCPGGGVCYAVNVPESAASSGTGDIFFQISGPSSMSWIGLGQGKQMSGSNIFLIYADAEGSNVTLSPRLGTGNQQPNSDTTAEVSLLDGSGILNNMMIANVKCSNCNSWSGGSMSFTDASSNWIWAYKSGAAVSSDSVSASISQHTKFGETTFNLQNAAGGSSANPFSTTAAATSGSSSSSSSSSGSTSDLGSSSSSGSSNGALPNDFVTVRMAHAIMAPVAFVLFFPLGAMAIRLLSFRGVVWFHAGWMVFTYIIVLGSMGMGLWIAVVSDQLDTTHSIIGLVVVGGLLLQPISGLTHHLLYKRTGGANVATYPHIWWGRAIVTLGIINGSLGLSLSDNTSTGHIAYGAVSIIMWVLWMGVILVSFIKTKNKGEKGHVYGTEMQNTSTERMRYPDSIQQSSSIREYSRSDEWPRAQRSMRAYK